MADIGKKVKEAATKAAKDKVSGEKKGKGTGGSKSGDRHCRADHTRFFQTVAEKDPNSSGIHRIVL